MPHVWIIIIKLFVINPLIVEILRLKTEIEKIRIIALYESK